MNRRSFLPAVGCFATLIALSLTACSQPEPPAEVDRYSTRGIVRQMPNPDKPGSELFIHHEAIPDFRNMKGEQKGMDSMVMPFPFEDPALIEDLAVGDKVDFDFEVTWEGSPPMRLTRMEKLPTDTRLEFEPAPEAEAEADDSNEAEANDEGEAEADDSNNAEAADQD